MDFSKQIQDSFKSFTKYESALLAIFIIYFIFPFRFPDMFGKAFVSLPGFVLLFCLVVFIFMYSHPILGVFSVLALYEFFNKNKISPANDIGRYPYVQYSSEQQFVPLQHMTAPVTEMEKVPSPMMKPDDSTPLEIMMVEKMAPIGQSDTGSYLDSSYKPVANPLHSASLYQ